MNYVCVLQRHLEILTIRVSKVYAEYQSNYVDKPLLNQHQLERHRRQSTQSLLEHEPENTQKGLLLKVIT